MKPGAGSMKDGPPSIQRAGPHPRAHTGGRPTRAPAASRGARHARGRGPGPPPMSLPFQRAGTLVRGA